MAEHRDDPADDRQEDQPPDQAEIDRQWEGIVAGLEPPVWGPRDYTVDDEDEGDFVAPDPPALGSGRPAVALSAAGLAGGPVALLLAALFWPGIPGLVVTLLIAVMVAGGVGLFLSLPRDQDRDGPWGGDGAQV
ncbi:hypothetical protein ABDK96_14245 [Citricoccus nitrophenolicus]|uniref:Uncharacterized protein n=1 Tax=Citricoccus nitrophenolicus TaxID=863575 RepID=A0ABV0IL66_9MICC|nr:hypothetical protein [Citricoccus sp. I39-566]WMY77636.1 hypothetical protein RE421_12440 [Citricoccus sp. I39-566]